jgi:Zn-dependent M28 family amino/carboxypeptidase
MRRHAWILTLLLAACGENAVVTLVESAEDRLAGAASHSTLWASLHFLADDALEGRAPGTRGGDLAAKYVASEFRRIGLEPAGDNGTFFHRVPIVSLTPEPSLTIRADGVPGRLSYPDDFVLWSMRDEADVGVQSDLVFVGFGIVAPEWQWNDYEGLDVAGKIVVAFVNDPGLVDTTLFRGTELTYYGRWTYKIEEAARQGADGILLVHTETSATYPWGTVSGSWTGPQVRVETPATSLQVAGWLSRSVGEALLQPVGETLERAMDQAVSRDWRPVTLAASATARVRSTISRLETMNVVGRLTGWGSHPNETVVIGGHYDHLGIGEAVDGDSIYNGAVDNASGTAAVITAAEAFVTSGVRPDRSILFMAFGAEESGLIGSRAFAARPTLPLRDLVAVFNMDGLNLYGQTVDVAALGLDHSSIGTAFSAAANAEGLDVSTSEEAILNGYFFRSDHFPFVQAGVPALSIQDGKDFMGREAGWGDQMSAEYLTQRYHRPGDELLTWYRPDGAMQQLRVILRSALRVAEASDRPTWNDGSEFKAAGEARLAN